MPATLDAAPPAPAPSARDTHHNNSDNGAPSSALARSRRARPALLALQATCFVLGIVITALMANVLYIAQDVETEDPGYVIHRASSGVVVWDGVGGALSAAMVGWMVWEGARKGRVMRVSLTGRESIPIYVLPTLLALLLFALARSLIATVYSFVDFNTANALALVWDGETATRPRYFTPETYAANQGWGDSTSPEVAAQARAARVCCAVLTVLTGLAAQLAFAIWRRERMGRDHERVSSVADDGDEVERKEVGGREVVEMEDRGRAELGVVKGDGGMHEASGRPLHEMEAGAGAHEVEGRYLYEVEGTHAHEMSGDEGRRMVYEMDASEPAQRKEREEGERKWEQWP